MPEQRENLCTDRRGQGPALHPLEIAGSPRRCYLGALGAQLLGNAGLLAAATGLLVATPTSALLVTCGVAAAIAGKLGRRAWGRRAWAGLPASGRPSALPVTEDRRFTAAAAALMSAVALTVSTLGPTGAFLAAMVGLDALVAAVDSFRRLAGHAPHPARRAPALLTAAAVSWGAATAMGGLGVHGVLALSGAVGMLAAIGLSLDPPSILGDGRVVTTECPSGAGESILSRDRFTATEGHPRDASVSRRLGRVR